jgi:uncharacterized protein (TIGR03435 family)
MGPGLRESSSDPCPTAPPSPAAARKPGQLPDPACGQIIFEHGQMKGQKAPPSSLAGVLSAIVGRTVVDRTGLNGRLDFNLEWTPDDLSSGNGPDSAAPLSNVPGPSIFTAVQEQLGLKLDSQKGPAEVLIVDRAEHASEN